MIQLHFCIGKEVNSKKQRSSESFTQTISLARSVPDPTTGNRGFSVMVWGLLTSHEPVFFGGDEGKPRRGGENVGFPEISAWLVR